MRPIACIQSSIRVEFFLVRKTTVRKAGKTPVIAWETLTTDESGSEEPAMPASAGLIYRLIVAFPAWTGAMLAIYAIFSSRFVVSKFDSYRIGSRQNKYDKQIGYR
ncbi:MAG: hypothetical protein WA172_02520 [Terriglobales bacterium]